MKPKHTDIEAFLALLRPGLWEDGGASLTQSPFNGVDWEAVLRLSQEQTVEGLVAAGMERAGESVPKVVRLQFLGRALLTEQESRKQVAFQEKLCKKLAGEGINFVVVKGQSCAQCYARPLWRTCGDIDLLLDKANYDKAKALLLPIATDIEAEQLTKRHLAMKIGGVPVELHGRMPFGMSARADKEIDKAIDTIWATANRTGIPIPGADEHVFLVFTHMLHHFFIEGVGLRQISDWCRMLWAYRETLDRTLLEKRITASGLLTEWRAFAALAVDHLGMPSDAIPMHNHSKKYSRKAKRVMKRVLQCGNFGHNHDQSYRTTCTGMKYYAVSLGRRARDFASLLPIFPTDAPRFYAHYAKGKTLGDSEHKPQP